MDDWERFFFLFEKVCSGEQGLTLRIPPAPGKIPTKYFELIYTQDEVRDPRQVLARPTWAADRGVRCDRPQWSGKNVGRAFRLANGNFGLFGLANTLISVCSL